MKKTIYVVIALLLLLLPMVLFTSCEEEKCAHTYGEWSVVTEPTCGKAGKQTRICSKCEKPENKSINATGKHTFGEWTVEQQPNCNTEGERSHTCTVCDQTAYETLAPAGEHVYENGQCKICKEPAATVGLEYIVYDESTCGVSGIGTATDLDIKIPRTNNGKTVIAIEDDAFEGSNIKSIQITENIIRIGKGAFHGCTALKIISFGLSQIVTVEDEAFADCTSLSTVYLPSTLVSVGNWAFSGCTKLTVFAAAVGDALDSFGDGAFYGCTSLVEFTIPASVTTVGARAFEACSKLEEITVETVNNKSKLATVGARAFYGCRSLTTVSFGTNSQLKTLAASAFENCSALQSIVLPKSLKTLESGVFKGCTALNSVTLEVQQTTGSQSAAVCTWTLVNVADSADNLKLTVESAADAAMYLKNTYLNYNWTRA